MKSCAPFDVADCLDNEVTIAPHLMAALEDPNSSKPRYKTVMKVVRVQGVNFTQKCV